MTTVNSLLNGELPRISKIGLLADEQRVGKSVGDLPWTDYGIGNQYAAGGDLTGAPAARADARLGKTVLARGPRDSNVRRRCHSEPIVHDKVINQTRGTVKERRTEPVNNLAVVRIELDPTGPRALAIQLVG